MANSLYNLPVLGAYMAAQDRGQQQNAAQLEQGVRLMQFGDMMQKQQQRSRLQEMAQMAGGDPNKLIEGYMRMGDPEGAARVAQVSGVIDAMRDRSAMRGAATDAFSPTSAPGPSGNAPANPLEPYMRYANALAARGFPDKAVAFLKQAREALTPKYQRVGTELIAPPDPMTGAPASAVYSAPEKTPDSVRAFEAEMRGAGIDPSSPQGQALYRARVQKQATHAPANSTTVVMNQEKEFAKAVGKAFGDAYVDLQKAGEAAQSKMNRLDRMQFLMQGVKTGKLTPTTKQIAEIADALGFKVDATLPAQQAIQALSSEMALQARNPSGGAGMPGAMSDKDREFLQAMQPGLSQTPGGNEFIIETMRKLAQRDAQVAKLARAYRAKKGTMDEGFYEVLAQFSAKNPLFTPTETKSVNGKTLMKINGIWMEQ